jgi:hypothetical protein
MRVPRDLAHEEGAIVVQAAMVMLVLIGFCAFVVDHGVLWLARAQAQNAADAGALAGAVGRAYDDAGVPPSSSGPVGQSIAAVLAVNPVWFETAGSAVFFDCPPQLPGAIPCVRVDVHRDGTADSTPLPMLFGPALGLTTQGVRATATAQVAVGNGTTCLKPWAIPDKWDEHRPVDSPWDPSDVFERYQESGPGAGSLLVPADEYVAPDGGGPGSGLTFAADIGLEITLSFADPTTNGPISPGYLLPLVLPGPKTYEQNIAGCNGRLAGVGQFAQTGDIGMETPTTDGFNALIAMDPGASWNAGTNRIDGSCAPSCAAVSPRLVTIALFDVDLYQLMRATDDWSLCPGVPGNRCAKVINFIGFFLDHTEAGGDAVGYVTRHPGLLSADFPSLTVASSFLPAITLVR